MSVVTCEDMIEKIANAMVCRKQPAQKFVPHTLLRQLMTWDAVRGVLLEHNSELCQDTNPELVEFFSKNSFKVFAILVMNEQLHLAQHFYQCRFEDNMLPVEQVWLDDNGDDWKIGLCNKGSSYDKILRDTFRLGQDSPWGKRARSIENFCQSWQWPFIPPIFVKDTFRYKFPDSIHLPFIESFDRKLPSDCSFYSYVEEKCVHVDHLPEDAVRRLSLLLIWC